MKIAFSCYFNLKPCNSTRDFQWFFHPTYGNCIQYNANAFDLKHYLIKNTKKINSDIKNILSIRGPVFVEVITDHNQKIFDAFKDY